MLLYPRNNEIYRNKYENSLMRDVYIMPMVLMTAYSRNWTTVIPELLMISSDSVVKGLSQSRDKGLNFEGKKSNSAGESNPSSKFTERNSLVSEGILVGQRIAKISVVTLVSIGIVEILTGYYSGSVVATADGLDSISDAAISFIVLLGLRIAHRQLTRSFILDIIR